MEEDILFRLGIPPEGLQMLTKFWKFHWSGRGEGVNSVGNSIGRGSYCWKFHGIQ